MSEPQYNIDYFNNFFKLPLVAMVSTIATEFLLNHNGIDMGDVTQLGLYTGILTVFAGLTKAQNIPNEVLVQHENSMLERSKYLPVLYGACNMVLGYATHSSWDVKDAGVGIGIAGGMLLAEYIVHEKNKKMSHSEMGTL